MGVFADRARKVAALAKAQEAGDVELGNPEGPPRPNHGAKLDREEKPNLLLPNLPQALSREEKKYLLAVERGDTSTVKRMLQKAARNKGYLNKDCVDPLGRGSLHMSIDNENLEMVELLVVMGVATKDSLLHAIDVEFVEAVEVLLEHEEIIHKDGEPYSWENMDMQTAAFTPEITPLILAAHRNNYEILKILLDRGAALPMPHDIRCGCEECIKSCHEDSLKHSRARISAYQALASPSLIALSSTDPILTAFELSDELKRLSYEESEFSSKYMELRSQCRNFAQELLSHSRSSTELAVILNYDPESPPYEDGDYMQLRRLELAIDYKQKGFVAHPNVQQLMSSLWYSGLPGFKRLGLKEKLITLFKVVFFFPVYCVSYMLFPNSERSQRCRSPFMKFLLHSSSYLFFLLMLILFSVRFTDHLIFFFGTESMVENLIEGHRIQRGNLPSVLEIVILMYVFGFVWEEITEIRKDGFKKYLRNMWNLLDVLRDMLYLSTMFLRVFAYIQQYQEISVDPQTAYIPREEWDGFDPQLISEGLFAAANVLSALKLVHIFSINPYLGPLQISLGRMVVDIVKFLVIYVLVLFAFACGLTQLLWYFNDLERQKCYSLPGGLPDWVKNGDACMKWRRFHNLFEASQTLFWAGFGMIGLEDFELTGAGGYTRFWSMLMFGAYSVINIIVLLNLLIAMMSNSYSFIVEHADKEWKFARTKLWMSYFEERGTLPPPFNILPSAKLITNIFKPDKREELMRKWSSKKIKAEKAARNYRYLSVMRALVWRYVAAMQQKSLDRAVTEDDVNEVKGDISSFRFELIDLFKDNGMDTSNCEQKSRAALGRKMRIWERRLMRDFHVSPAMGTDEDDLTAVPDTAGDAFKRIAKLAMLTKMSSDGPASQAGGSQIGRRASQPGVGDETENLKKAMERARRKMEEDTPDNSPASSRGCSPFPELYMGPNLLSTIESLDLSPDASLRTTPFASKMGTMRKSSSIDKAATDPSMLTVPGRRAESKLRKREGSNDSDDDKEIVVPSQSNMAASSVVSSQKDSSSGTTNERKEAPLMPKPKTATAPKTVGGSMVEQRLKNFQPGSNRAAGEMTNKPQELNVRKLIEYSPEPHAVDKPCIIDVNSPRPEPTVASVESIKAQFSSAAPKPTSILKNSQATTARQPAPVMKGQAPSGPGAECGGARRNSGGNLDYGSPAELETMDFVRRPKPRK